MLLLIAGPMWVLAQDFSEKITKEFTFEKKGLNNTILLANINGDIRVEGYEGDKVLLEKGWRKAKRKFSWASLIARTH